MENAMKKPIAHTYYNYRECVLYLLGPDSRKPGNENFSVGDWLWSEYWDHPQNGSINYLPDWAGASEADIAEWLKEGYDELPEKDVQDFVNRLLENFGTEFMVSW